MFALLTEIAKQAGIIGLVVALMGGGFALVIKTLWAQHLSAMEKLQEQLDKSRTKLDESHKLVHALQEKRVQDAEKTRDLLLEHSEKMVLGLERIAIVIDFAKGVR